MTQEEKAKAYDKALEKAKIWKDKSGMPKDKQGILDDIFPELKEGGDDKIIKALKEGFKYHQIFNPTFGGIPCVEIVNWLEKQKSIGEIVERCKDSWYNEGKIQGQIEGLSDEEKYQQGWHDALEKQVHVDKEEDDRIRRHLIKHFGNKTKKDWNGVPVHSILTWLEKQGKNPQGKSALEDINEEKIDKQNCIKPADFKAEHFYVSKVDGQIHDMTYNPADKVEPKFRNGQWIVSNTTKDIFLIKSVNSGYCTLEDTKGRIYTPCLPPIEDDYHLYTIQDAKDGDVLAFDNDTIVIFKNLHNTTSFSFDSYCHIKNGVFNFSRDDYMIAWCNGIDFHPATKEQRDLLFKKMIEAGYEWDAEKKELKDMKVTSSTYCSENCKGYQETGKCFANGECDSKRKHDNMLDSCEIEHIEDGKYYYCIKDYYADGNKKAAKGDVIQAHRGMSMMALGTNANEYFLPVKRCSLSFVKHLDV